MAGGSDFFFVSMQDSSYLHNKPYGSKPQLDKEGNPVTRTEKDADGNITVTELYETIEAAYMTPIVDITIQRQVQPSGINFTKSNVMEKSGILTFTVGGSVKTRSLGSGKYFYCIDHRRDDPQQADHFITETETWRYQGDEEFMYVINPAPEA